MFCNLLTEQCEKHFLYDLQLCASCLIINFQDFLDHVRVIIYYTITSLSRLHHSIIICCSRKIANNMKGSISPCSPLTTRARRVCHANRPREYSKGPQIITQPVDVINRRWTKTILRYSNATVRGKKIQKLHVNVSSGILKTIYPAWGFQIADLIEHRWQKKDPL